MKYIIVISVFILSCIILSSGETTYMSYRGNDGLTGYFDTQGIDELHGVKWKYQVFEKELKNYPVVTSPVIVNDTIIFNRISKLIALDKNTGEKRWEYFIEEGKSGSANGVSPILANKQYIYISDLSGGINCIDGLTGKRLWRTGLGYISLPMTIYDNKLYCVTDVGELTGYSRLHILNGENGNIVKEELIINEEQVPYIDEEGNQMTFLQTMSNAIACNGKVYIAKGTKGEILEINPDTLEVQILLSTGFKINILVSTDNYLYCMGDKDVSKIDVKSKKILNRFTVQEKWIKLETYPVKIKDYIVFFGREWNHELRKTFPDTVFVLDSNLKKRYTYQETHIAIKEKNASFVGSQGMYIYYYVNQLKLLECYSIDKQKVQWTLPIRGPISTPVIENGVIYFGAGDGYFYALH